MHGTTGRGNHDAMAGRRLWVAAAAMAWFLPAAGLSAQTTEARDTVVLESGTKLRGRVVRVSDQEITLRVGSVDRTIPRRQVQSIDSVASKHRELLVAWQDTAVDDAAALVALAERAAAAGLPHEKRLLYWYAALLRPNDAEIHRALGNRERNGTFLVPIADAWVPFSTADRLGEDFAKAWSLRSEHFTLRSAAGLRVGLNTLLELEALYQVFHDLFGASLQLFELVEPIPVNLYRTRAQMPNLSDNVSAYFSASEPALFTYAADDRAWGLLHEGTHALQHFFFERAAKSRGALPAWLDEGWAEYMDGRVHSRVPGKLAARERSVMAVHSTVLASVGKDELYGVHRLLNFKHSDFMASSRQDTKYAQSWALFRYLFEHPDAVVRQQFVEYLRAAAIGQGQASTFRRIFARLERELDRAPWQ